MHQIAKIQIDSGRGFDLRDIDFSNLYEGSYYTTTSNLFAVHYSSGAVDEFRGSDFRYNSDGEPTGGTVHSYAFVYGGKLVSVDGISVSATRIVDAAKTFSTGDDHHIIRTALAGDDTFTGGSASDYWAGFDGNDKLSGKDGADRLDGGNGHDTLVGGVGRDYLKGGSDSDIFLFSRVADSTKFSNDKILDFSQKEHDVIDLAGVDANGRIAGNKDFEFIGQHEFHGDRGELRFEIKHGTTFGRADECQLRWKFADWSPSSARSASNIPRQDRHWP